MLTYFVFLPPVTSTSLTALAGALLASPRTSSQKMNLIRVQISLYVPDMTLGACTIHSDAKQHVIATLLAIASYDVFGVVPKCRHARVQFLRIGDLQTSTSWVLRSPFGCIAIRCQSQSLFLISQLGHG
uniref:Secreted protein n=1 Tax=Ascaris lumbricoides TaxID=6252 RepID=A0A0M3HVW5_ASCLU